MLVLQISNDYAGSKVHKNLIQYNDSHGIKQIVYCPVRNSQLLGGNQFKGENVEFVYSLIIKPWYKFFYHHKRKKLFSDLSNRIDLNKIDLIHAATLFSDGAIAYMAHKKYNIPYVVAVRNTDVNLFAKLLPHTWKNAQKILLESSKIYFISKALQNTFITLPLVKPILRNIENKFIFRPNGVEDIWLKNINHNQNKYSEKILYVGNFTANKNIKRLIISISQLRTENKYKDLKLTIIGGGKDKNNEVLNIIKSNCDFVTYLGEIYNSEKIQDIMKEHALFAMPSIYETFGLVYIEALTQNLPIIYTKGQGVDKVFLDNEYPVGISVDPLSISEIKEAIRNILSNYEKYSNKQIDFSIFDWENISQQYKIDYENIVISK